MQCFNLYTNLANLLHVYLNVKLQIALACCNGGADLA